MKNLPNLQGTPLPLPYLRGQAIQGPSVYVAGMSNNMTLCVWKAHNSYQIIMKLD